MSLSVAFHGSASAVSSAKGAIFLGGCLSKTGKDTTGLCASD